jgi:hypothetical protein
MNVLDNDVNDDINLSSPNIFVETTVLSKLLLMAVSNMVTPKVMNLRNG